MNQRLDTDNYKDLLINDTPLLDVRAPVEYTKGAFPHAYNLPLLNDDQRKQIGTCYKRKGQQAAIELGWQLATPEVKQQRITAWAQYIQKNPKGFLYCFRGGLRSHLSQQLLRDEAGIDYPLVKGGYKAMRRFLIDELDQNCMSMKLVLISGRTGTGKTLAIHQIPQSIDLEGLAKHRGSAFGRQIEGQPAQIDFENALSIKMMKLSSRKGANQVLFCEDESKHIGRVMIPMNFLHLMKGAPIAILETPIEQRIDITLKSYVEDDLPCYLQCFGQDEGMEKFKEQVLSNVSRIRKKFGEQNYKLLYGEFENALNELKRTGNSEHFRPGIELLLTKYYDPMYDYGTSKKEDRVIFRGERDDMDRWAKDFRSLG